MRILHTESSLGWGGQEIRILNEATGMIARGHQVSLVCSPDACIYREAQHRNIPVKALPIAKKNLTGLLAMRRYLQTDLPDVVNTHSSTDSWLVALASACLGNAPPLVRTRHISAPLSNNAATRWLYGRATQHIVTTGEKLREQMIAEARLAPNKVTSIPTGIDLQRFVPGNRMLSKQNLALPSDKLIIGIVATLRSWKGHRYLLQAFSHNKCAEHYLVVVGDGPLYQLIESEVASFGLTSQVKLVGNQQDVIPWLQAFDIFCLPSYANEGVPQALLQAMACQLPVISTPVGSIEEIVIPEVNGLLVKPKDSGELAAAIMRLANGVELRDQLAMRARQTALNRFSDQIMLDRMEQVFSSCVRPSQGRA